MKAVLKLGMLVGLLLTSATVHAEIPAFPGAEGFGAYATGGRGGDVYIVTSLANSGAGTLRDALNTVPAAGRTIVFAVSGYIRWFQIPISRFRITSPLPDRRHRATAWG